MKWNVELKMKLHIHQSKTFNVLLVLNNEAVKKNKNNSSDVWNEMANFKWKNQSSRAACVADDILTLNMFLKSYVELYEHQSIEKYANF